jgi:hypothetical protein
MSPDPSQSSDGAAWMQRFYALRDGEVAGAVDQTSAGNYALGYLDGSSFTVFYVGRSDSDLGSSLRAWVGAPSQPRRHRASPRAPWRSRAGPMAGLGTHALGRIALGLDTGYTHFAFCYAPSAIAAYEQECVDYHGLGGSDNLDNPCHPLPPTDTPWACPVHGRAA